jgi:hypothetical protein
MNVETLYLWVQSLSDKELQWSHGPTNVETSILRLGLYRFGSQLCQCAA